MMFCVRMCVCCHLKTKNSKNTTSMSLCLHHTKRSKILNIYSFLQWTINNGNKYILKRNSTLCFAALSANFKTGEISGDSILSTAPSRFPSLTLRSEKKTNIREYCLCWVTFIHNIWISICVGFDSSLVYIRSRGTAFDKKQWPFYSKCSQVNCHSISVFAHLWHPHSLIPLLLLVLVYSPLFFAASRPEYEMRMSDDSMCRSVCLSNSPFAANVCVCALLFRTFTTYIFTNQMTILGGSESKQWTFTRRNHLIVVCCVTGSWITIRSSEITLPNTISCCIEKKVAMWQSQESFDTRADNLLALMNTLSLFCVNFTIQPKIHLFWNLFDIFHVQKSILSHLILFLRLSLNLKRFE